MNQSWNVWFFKVIVVLKLSSRFFLNRVFEYRSMHGLTVRTALVKASEEKYRLFAHPSFTRLLFTQSRAGVIRVRERRDLVALVFAPFRLLYVPPTELHGRRSSENKAPIPTLNPFFIF